MENDKILAVVRCDCGEVYSSHIWRDSWAWMLDHEVLGPGHEASITNERKKG